MGTSQWMCVRGGAYGMSEERAKGPGPGTPLDVKVEDR